MPLILPSNSISAGGYDVANSLRFDDGSSDYLSRTPASASGRRTFTFSFWIKRGVISSVQTPFSAGNSSTEQIMRFESGDTFYILDYQGAVKIEIRTSRVFRDPSAWYHIVVAVDTTQATASNRVKIYVNGVQETSFGTETYPAQDTDLMWNSNVLHAIGRKESGDNEYLDGYLAEVVNIDGSQLDPTSFGEFDEATGIWKPIDVSELTFGTNGFYLDFENSGSLGADVSGNGNNFTVNNLTSIDQTTDTPTNNFATMNPLAIYPTSTFTFSQGNLEFATSSSTRGYWVSTIAVSSGKWYWEYKATNNQARTCVGIAGAPTKGNNDPESGTHDNVTVYLTINGQVSINSGGSTDSFYNTATSSNNIIIGCALDLDSSPNTIAFSIDGEWVTGSGTKSTDFSSATKINSFTNVASTVNGVYHFIAGDDGGDQDIDGQANFGNPPFTISSGNSDGNGYGNFEYSVPSGYYALNTKNLSEFG